MRCLRLKRIVIQVGLFACLWYFVFVSTSSAATLPWLVIVCAIVFALYFFLPLTQKPLILLILAQVVGLSTMWLDVSLARVMVVVAFLTWLGTDLLSPSPFQAYALVSALVASVLTIVGGHDVALLVLFFFYLFAAVVLNRMLHEIQEKKEMHAQLLGELRRMKRSTMAQENMVRLEERTRIGRDIHDSVGHKLTALLMQLEMDSMQEGATDYTKLKELARASLEETRFAVRELRSEEVYGLQSVLQLLRKLESESHLLVQFTTEKGILSVPLSNAQSITLYRAIQEALTNAMRHGETKEVAVTIGRSVTGDLQFSVMNHNRNPKSFQEGFGLTQMRARLEEIHGKLHIYQTETQFVIEGSFPIEGISR